MSDTRINFFPLMMILQICNIFANLYRLTTQCHMMELLICYLSHSKVKFLKLWQVDHFLFLQIYRNKRAQQWKFYAYIFSEQLFGENICLFKISAVGLFSCDKFEETPKQKVIDLSKLKEFYFSKIFKLDVSIWPYEYLLSLPLWAI